MKYSRTFVWSSNKLRPDTTARVSGRQSPGRWEGVILAENMKFLHSFSTPAQTVMILSHFTIFCVWPDHRLGPRPRQYQGIQGDSKSANNCFKYSLVESPFILRIFDTHHPVVNHFYIVKTLKLFFSECFSPGMQRFTSLSEAASS